MARSYKRAAKRAAKRHITGPRVAAAVTVGTLAVNRKSRPYATINVGRKGADVGIHVPHRAFKAGVATGVGVSLGKRHAKRRRNGKANKASRKRKS